VQDNGLDFDPAEDFANLVYEATPLRVFTTDLVSTVLQLPGYTSRVMQNDDPVRIARLAMVREAWAARLNDRAPLTVHAVFPEEVLRQAIGGPRVMKAQLLHLSRLSMVEVGWWRRAHGACRCGVIKRGAHADDAGTCRAGVLE
jgi:hypothetical protein